MALPQPQQAYRFYRLLFTAALFFCVLQSCQHAKKVYKSDCDAGVSFKRVNFGQLMDSIQNYDQQYIEVSGKYEEDKDLSALYGDNVFPDKSTTNGLWVNFSQDCPLYLSGTHEAFLNITTANLHRSTIDQ
jgi:hypothetical protein